MIRRVPKTLRNKISTRNYHFVGPNLTNLVLIENFRPAPEFSFRDETKVWERTVCYYEKYSKLE